MILTSKNKNFTNIKDLFQKKCIDIQKVIIGNNVSFCKKGFKYFIGYKDAKKLDLYVYYYQKWKAYRRDFDKTKYIPFMIKHDELFEK